jgi:hypothetical protein
VLDQQFERLSDLVRALLLWMAIERAPVTAQVLGGHLVHAGSWRTVLEALRWLQRQSLLEAHGAGVSLQNVVNVVMEYATDHLIERLCQEIVDGRLDYWNSHALLMARANEYIRQA